MGAVVTLTVVDRGAAADDAGVWKSFINPGVEPGRPWALPTDIGGDCTGGGVMCRGGGRMVHGCLQQNCVPSVRRAIITYDCEYRCT